MSPMWSAHSFETDVRILYLADIRFPLERANGIQTIETCYALAERGHSVLLFVRPDTAKPPRDPFAFYDLTPHARLVVRRAHVFGPEPARRVAYVAQALAAAVGIEVGPTSCSRAISAWRRSLLRLPRPIASAARVRVARVRTRVRGDEAGTAVRRCHRVPVQAPTTGGPRGRACGDARKDT